MYTCIIKQKIQVFAINIGYFFILWYEIYHISFEATATHEIFIFIPFDVYKSCIIKEKKLEYPLYIHNDGFIAVFKSFICHGKLSILI
jgi:hypothetical protein